MSDYPQNTKKGEQTKRYKAVYNQKALRMIAAVREKTAASAMVNTEPVAKEKAKSDGKAKGKAK
jgi:hypothetical protein